MRQKRLQNKVAGSEWTLPVCAISAVAMWWLPQRSVSVPHLIGLLLSLLTAYIVMETNARYYIIRIRTRMMTCVWLILSASLAFVHAVGNPLCAALFLSLSYFFLFRCYQRTHPQLDVFHAFLMLSLGSFFAPVMLAMAVPYFFYLAAYLRSLSRKAFWAGIIGIAVPYWCYAVWCFATRNMEELQIHFADMVQPELPSLEAVKSLALGQKAAAAVIAFLGIAGIMHYLRTNFDDKIRVRMILYIYVSQTLLLLAYLALQPSHYDTTMALLVCSAGPLIAHHLSLAKGWFGTAYFIVAIILTAAMAVLQLVGF